MIKSSSVISFHPHSASRGACLDGQAAGCPLRAAGCATGSATGSREGREQEGSLSVALPAPGTAPACQSSAGHSAGSCQPSLGLCATFPASAAAKFLLCLKVTLGIQPRARCCYLCLCRDSLLPWEKLVAAGFCALQSDRNFAHPCCAHLWYQDDDSLCQVFEKSFPLLSVLCEWISVRFVLLLQLPVLWLVWPWGCSVFS